MTTDKEERMKWLRRLAELNEETGLMPDVFDAHGSLCRPWSDCETLRDIADEVGSAAAAAGRKVCRLAGMAGAIKRAANEERLKGEGTDDPEG
ncbi:MAG TPA: hypothetical protein VNA25_30340 [Phycisphaerae bacterium]|nr:hypothetical protein [Phycisphaerae bacterium]